MRNYHIPETKVNFYPPLVHYFSGESNPKNGHSTVTVMEYDHIGFRTKFPINASVVPINHVLCTRV